VGLRWFDRTFAFTFGVEMGPCVLSRLRGTPPRLEELTHGLSQESLVRRIADTWSIQENAGHLLDLEELWAGRVMDFMTGKETLRAADLTNRRTHEARHNDTDIAAILDAFRQARARLLRSVESLEEADFGKTALHPRLRHPMRLVDHLFFVAEHDDHHLARIHRLRQA
jgi:uncharacterized damage-inducible protein DinB